MIDSTDNTVTVCMDCIKGRCVREKCKYFHPPAHLQVRNAFFGCFSGILLKTVPIIPSQWVPISCGRMHGEEWPLLGWCANGHFFPWFSRALFEVKGVTRFCSFVGPHPRIYTIVWPRTWMWPDCWASASFSEGSGSTTASVLSSDGKSRTGPTHRLTKESVV